MTRFSRKSSRRGFSIIAVLALLTLAGSLFVTWTRHTLREHRQTRLNHQQTQAEWLANSALTRAVSRLSSDASYSGETWQLSPEDLDQSYAAEVRIDVDTEDSRITLTATVDLPPGESRRVRHTQSVVLSKPSAGDTP